MFSLSAEYIHVPAVLRGNLLFHVLLFGCLVFHFFIHALDFLLLYLYLGCIQN